jgi:flagellar biosynthesis/type III secretory pathway ATPase
VGHRKAGPTKAEGQFEIQALPRVSEDERLVALARGQPDAEGGYPISVTTHKAIECT